jgi:GH25 family lysozyme M1 (1,4-beta-N-acetylmuramidase)
VTTVLKLIDLSNNNPSPVDFRKVRAAGYYGVWHKVSEGVHFTDPDWHGRADAARMIGLHVGGYHFARPGASSPGEQARFFCSLLGTVHRRDLHPVLDLEDAGGLSSASLHTWATSFLSHVHERTGVKALTYTGPAFVSERNWTKTFGTGAGIWLAEYGPNDGTDHGPHPPKPWHQVVAHQYTSVGKVAGIKGNVDLSHARARRRVLAHGLRGIV